MITICPMQHKHTQQVHDIGEESFSTPWTLVGIQAELSNPNAVSFVAIKDGLVVGYITTHCIFEEGYINNIAVKSNYRRQGVGHLLIRHLFEYGKHHAIEYFTLEVRRSNIKAIRFYESVGFSKIGERKNMYEHPTEDAMLYSKAVVS